MSVVAPLAKTYLGSLFPRLFEAVDWQMIENRAIDWIANDHNWACNCRVAAAGKCSAEGLGRLRFCIARHCHTLIDARLYKLVYRIHFHHESIRRDRLRDRDYLGANNRHLDHLRRYNLHGAFHNSRGLRDHTVILNCLDMETGMLGWSGKAVRSSWFQTHHDGRAMAAIVAADNSESPLALTDRKE